MSQQNPYHIGRLLFGVGIFILSLVVGIICALYEWKKAGYVDPMDILIMVIGIFGIIVCILWIRLLIQVRKRDELGRTQDKVEK